MKYLKLATFFLTALLILSPAAFLFKIDAQSAYRGLILNQFRFEYGVVNPGDVIKDSFTVKHDFQPLDNGKVREVGLTPLVRNFEQVMEYQYIKMREIFQLSQILLPGLILQLHSFY
ncbi:MAG: hypothetical protein Kow0081_5010 [Candidatus Dojkabacteria bacterium]